MGSIIGKILGTGARDTIDSIGTTIDKIDKSDEKLAMQLKYKQLMMDIESSYLEYENKLLDSRTQLMLAETRGDSFLQRNWRPALMVICMFIIFNNYVLVPYFNIPMSVLDDHIWNLIEMGVTGYVAGRSLEKITEKLGPVLQNVKKKRKE